MIKETVLKILNDQLQKEFYSSYLYMSMAAYFADNNLMGFSKWMDVQAQEEVKHFRKIYEFIIERGGKVKLQAIAQPPHDWDSPLAVFRDSYKHEQFITESINNIVDLARKENDKATEVFCHWFVSEQVEEEASVESVVKKLELAKDAPGAIFMIDGEMGRRA